MKKNTIAEELYREINAAETWEDAEDAARALCDMAGIPLRRSEEDDIEAMIEQIERAAEILGIVEEEGV